MSHAGDYNSLSCALGHHIAEGRWLRDRQYVDGDIRFWLRTGEGGGLRKNLHQFSGWTSAAVYDRYLADGFREGATSQLEALVEDYAAWDGERLTESGLYWQRDVSDGMEESASGGRKVKNIRPSINSYMCGNARAISEIAALAKNQPLARAFREKAARLRDLTLRSLWNRREQFFETLEESGDSANVRENIGYTPWYFDLPPDGAGYEIAWKQTAVTREDYFAALLSYVKSQHITLEDGRTIPWIDENQNPLTGEWLAPYHGREVTILWDKTGAKSGKGKGLRVFADGKEIARAWAGPRFRNLGPPSRARLVYNSRNHDS